MALQTYPGTPRNFYVYTIAGFLFVIDAVDCDIWKRLVKLPKASCYWTL